MTIYEITDEEGEIIEASVIASEAARILNRKIGSLYTASAEGRIVAGKYRIKAVDTTLSKNRDWKLLWEFDQIRQQLLKKGRKYE